MNIYISYYNIYILSNIIKLIGNVIIIYYMSYIGYPISYKDYMISIYNIYPYEYIIIEEFLFRKILYDNNYKIWILNSIVVGIYYYNISMNILIMYEVMILSMISNIYMSKKRSNIVILIWSRLIIYFFQKYFLVNI